MRTICRLLGLCLAASFPAACAIHPIPHDVTGYSTAAIVEQIRCEAQAAVLDHIKRRDPRLYAAGSIGYDFTFTITENNNFGIDTSFLLPFSSGFGKFSSGASAGKDRQRQTERKFAMAERFTELASPDPGLRCPADGIRENWSYPITGRIGLSEIIKTYVELEGHSTRLDSFSDQVMFTTTIDASISPKVELNPLAGNLRLTQASGTFVADRKDVHKLRIVLVAKGEPRLGAVRAAGPDDSKSRALRELYDLRDRELRIIP